MQALMTPTNRSSTEAHNTRLLRLQYGTHEMRAIPVGYYTSTALSDSVGGRDGRNTGVGYFGPTSASHILSPSEEVPNSIDHNTSTSHVPLDMDSEQLEFLLLRSFFKDQELWVSVVHEETFLAHKRIGNRSQWYSNFLNAALFACGARLSTTGTVRDLGSEYARRARAEINFELENPSAASIQGFLLLSGYEATEGRDRVGWMLCGEID